jgi:hypothetical protein
MLRALGWSAHREAGAEVFTVALISVLPLLVGAMARCFQSENVDLSLALYGASLDSFLVHGELLLYALAFIAVVTWTALREWPAGLRPPRIVLGVFCIVSVGIITTFFCLDTAKVALHTEAILMSKIVFVVTLIFYYVATVLSKIEPPDLAASLSASSSALSSQLGPGASS